MIYMRIVVCVAGLVLAGLQLWQFQWALAISGVITALLALAGLVFGWEAIAESLPVQAGGALALLLGLFGTVTSSSAFNMELQEAQTAAMSASVYGAMGDYCERSGSELWGKATLHCAMQSNIDQARLSTNIGKTFYNPSPILSIADGLNGASEGLPVNACAAAFAEAYSRCPVTIGMSKTQIALLLKEASR